MTEPMPNHTYSMEDIFRRRTEEADRQALERRAQRLADARASVRENNRNPNSYIAAARCFKQMGELYEALDILRSGLDRCAPSPQLHEYYIERLEKCNRTEEAIAAARDAALLFPNELFFPLREALLLPVFYRTPEQVEQYRGRFTKGLQRIIGEVQLETPLDRQRAVEAIGKNVNKYLAYQGHDDRALNVAYGGWVHQIVKANYPQWTQPLPPPRTASDGRLRVGYVSSRFRDGSVTKAFLGWLREHNRAQVSVFAYHAHPAIDGITEQVRRSSEYFRQLPGPLAEAAKVVQADNLHILVFLDLGMMPWMTLLAALRLAPIQCMAWDYPVTSGLPTIDYYFTGDLMEVEDSHEHYSERLVRLPGVGVSYTKPVIPAALLIKTRRDFGLREDAVIYLSPQTVFKYLPRQDHLFAQMAMRVPNSQFVFLVTNEIVSADFKIRLGRAFAAVGLNAADHCVLLPEVSSLDYWNLHRVSDVVLDTIGWSGGVSTFEAVACGLPVVTLPGELMRGRQSYAILAQLGVTDTIASDELEYVDIAVRLAIDPEWRQSVIKRTVEAHPKLYSDARCVRALEDFYGRVVNEGCLPKSP
jgi:protein O-GlcNAc transferase